MKFILVIVFQIHSLNTYSKDINSFFTEIDNFDYLSLVNSSSNNSEVNELIKATVLFMNNNIRSSQKIVQRIIVNSKSNEIKIRAEWLLSQIEIKLQNYKKALKLINKINFQDVDSLKYDQNTVSFYKSLLGSRKIEVVEFKNSEIKVSIDEVGLLRMPVTINNSISHSIFDTGANFSVISNSKAKELDLMFIDDNAQVSGSTNKIVTTKIAFAETIRIADIKISNVPFLVVPDELLQFKENTYSVESIIGLPVISNLETIEYVNVSGIKKLKFSNSQDFPDKSNLILNGNEIDLIVKLEKMSSPTRMFLDSGANKSTLFNNEYLLQALLESLKLSKKTEKEYEGLGGSNTVEVNELTEVNLHINNEKLTYGPVSILPEQNIIRTGVLGIDIMTSENYFKLDLKKMYLKIGK